MNNTIYLVTAQEVRTLCPAINQEVADVLINGAILMIQDTEIKFTLTQDFYDDILINSGTTANKYLIDNYLKNLTSLFVWQYLAVSLSLQLNAAGLRLKTSDHSTAAESVDITFYRKYIDNFIDNVRKQMDRYIYDHQSSYPLYHTDKWGDTPVKSNFRIGRVGGNDNDYDDDGFKWPCY